MKMRLVHDWKEAGQWWSVRLAGASAMVGPAWIALPQELKDHIPVEWLPYISPVVLISIVLARVLDQGRDTE